MLGFTILSVLWLAGLALGGQADPAKHGWIFDSMMNELDCYHVLDQFNESADANQVIELKYEEPKEMLYKGCSIILSQLDIEPWYTYISLKQILPSLAKYLYYQPNIKNDWEATFNISENQSNSESKIAYVKILKYSTDDQNEANTSANSVDPDATCFNMTEFPPLVQADCQASFDLWTTGTKAFFPNHENMTWESGFLSFSNDSSTCQFVMYNNDDYTAYVSLTDVTDQVQHQIIDPCVSNGWYGGWQKNNTGLYLDFKNRGVLAWFLPKEFFPAVRWTFPEWLKDPADPWDYPPYLVLNKSKSQVFNKSESQVFNKSESQVFKQNESQAISD
ncbi:Putative protein of unknown function [Podospora comata]|uniref:Uncharacterized protein n=1 Tax=Podospora comata TaxID=48703 RepID=A0ABY6S2U9_PODCO|nr:Putative protein of unknown function [Podospora comata]